MKPPEQDCGEEGELQVREGSFIESIRIVCSNLFRNYHQSEGQEGGLTGTGGDVNINTHWCVCINIPHTGLD